MAERGEYDGDYSNRRHPSEDARAAFPNGSKHQMGQYRAHGAGLDGPPRIERGWQPTCAHDAATPVPCTVLDPFSGSGTVGVVALRHGRSFVGIDLNAEYVAMARKRITGDAPLFNRVVIHDGGTPVAEGRFGEMIPNE